MDAPTYILLIDGLLDVERNRQPFSDVVVQVTDDAQHTRKQCLE